MNRNEGLSNFFSKVYLWMFIGLLISGVTAYYTSITPSLLKFAYNSFMFIVIAELLIVIAFSALRQKVSPDVAKILFIIYSVTSGLTLSSIFIVYKLSSIGIVFLSAALMFGLLAAYGYLTKTDLSSFGKIMIFGLIAIIIMSVINIFVQGQTFGIVLSVISVILFLGLTAYDMQNLKNIYEYYSNDEQELSKASIYGALDLYLDFINIFIQLLNLFGKGKD